ncbi:FHA domain-containing protein [Spirosoma sp. SC4-14]|uniref:FHA domain-containing protein n=1 Tax=Spirosoma sp. SC4-14 TaxID=3128900 RepID=UPI0030CD7D83
MSLPRIDDSQLTSLIDKLSQLPVYSLGRKIDNTLVVEDRKVSGYHARLIQCTPDTFVLEDLDSKNGTFVNGSRITRKIITTADTIQLAETTYSVEQLLTLSANKPVDSSVFAEPTPQTPPNFSASSFNNLDYTAEFAALQLVFDQYPSLRRDCRNREKMIRTGSVILSSVVGISTVLATGGTAFPLLQIMSGAGLSMLVPTLCSTLLSTDEKLELIDKEFREKYRCPNPDCRDPFGMREWELLARQKTCRRCQAIWAK